MILLSQRWQIFFCRNSSAKFHSTRPAGSGVRISEARLFMMFNYFCGLNFLLKLSFKKFVLILFNLTLSNKKNTFFSYLKNKNEKRLALIAAGWSRNAGVSFLSFFFTETFFFFLYRKKFRESVTPFWLGWNHSTDHQVFFSNGMLSHLPPKVTRSLSYSLSLSVSLFLSHCGYVSNINTHAHMVCFMVYIACVCLRDRERERERITSLESFSQSVTV